MVSVKVYDVDTHRIETVVELPNVERPKAEQICAEMCKGDHSDSHVIYVSEDE